MQQQHLNKSGYITLMSTLIVLSMVSATVITLSLISTDETKMLGNLRNAKMARAYNISCIEKALMEIRNNTTFTGSNTLTFTQGSCTYTVQNTGGENRLVTSIASVDTILKNESVTVTKISPKITISNWEETQ